DRIKDLVPPISEITSTIIDTLQAHKALTAEQQEFADPFCTNPGHIEVELARYGIPLMTNAKKTKLDIYEGLVEKFEEKLIAANASIGESVKMSNDEMLHVAGGSLSDKAAKVAKE